MAIRCPQCGRLHDVARLEAARSLRCSCGTLLDLSLINNVDDFLRHCASEEERKKAEELQEKAQAICRMILDDSYAAVDIQIAQEKLRQRAQELFPDRMDLYAMLYEARFKRLWQQFRTPLENG